MLQFVKWFVTRVYQAHNWYVATTRIVFIVCMLMYSLYCMVVLAMYFLWGRQPSTIDSPVAGFVVINCIISELLIMCVLGKVSTSPCGDLMSTKMATIHEDDSENQILLGKQNHNFVVIVQP